MSASIGPRRVRPPPVTAGSVGLLVVHSNNRGDTRPDDIALTARLKAAAAVLDLSLLGHLIVDDDLYLSPARAGRLGATPPVRSRSLCRRAQPTAKEGNNTGLACPLESDPKQLANTEHGSTGSAPP